MKYLIILSIILLLGAGCETRTSDENRRTSNKTADEDRVAIENCYKAGGTPEITLESFSNGARVFHFCKYEAEE